MAEKKNPHSLVPPTIWGASLLLLILLYLMYAPSFTLDYLMNDELRAIGKENDPLRAFVGHFIAFGRPMFGVYHSLVYRFAGYDPVKVQFIRFVNFASLAAVGLVLFRFLHLRSKSVYLSFFTILFLFSQLSFQGLIGYSVQVISNSQPSIWLSLGAFYLHFYFFPKLQVRKWIAYATTFIVFVAAMHSTQTYAYFSMIPLSYLVLTENRKHNKRILIFFVLALASFIFSMASYKVAMEVGRVVFDRGAYKLGEEAMTALTGSPLQILFAAANPLKYWSAFKVWTYPYPFHYTLPLEGLKQFVAGLVMVAWLSLIIGGIVTEISKSEREGRGQILLKWLGALACLGFGAIFMVADSPLEISDLRPHMTITFVGVCIFTGAYATQVLSSSYKAFNSGFAKSSSILFIVLTAFGAQSSLLRGAVNIRENQMNFIRTELSSKSPDAYRKVVVVLDPDGPCITEPCDLWFGNVTHGEGHQTRPERYKYALTTLGIAPESKSIVFVDDYPEQIAEDELIVDWEKYVEAQKRHLNYLRRNR